MEDFTLRTYRPGDEVSINRSFNKIFKTRRSLKEWRWKFRPADDGSRIIVAVDRDQRVIAHYGALRLRLQIDGQEAVGGEPLDAFCLSEGGATQRRLFTKTVKEFYRHYRRADRFCGLFGFPSLRHYRLGRIVLEYGDPYPFPVLGKDLAGRKLWRWRPKPANSFDPLGFDRFWERCSPRYPVCVIRDSARIKYRYLDCPGNRYTFLSLSGKEGLKAWCCLRRVKRLVTLVDLLWDGRDQEDLIGLNERIQGYAASVGAKSLKMWLSGDEEADGVFRSLGWSPLEDPDPIVLVVMTINPELDFAESFKRLYFTMGDSDLI